MSTVRATILSLTSLRGVAALVVMAYHMRQVWNEAYGLDSLTPAIERGYLWVDFFFILSGFIMAYVYGETLMNRQGG
ncbi:MAG: acyltransferase family protein [Geminicoccaceae bacterium]